jgi:hypothetical protein
MDKGEEQGIRLGRTTAPRQRYGVGELASRRFLPPPDHLDCTLAIRLDRRHRAAS